MKNNRQIPLFWNEKENDGKIDIGNDLSLKFLNVAKTKLHYYRHNTLIKKVDLSDNPEKRLFVVEAAEQGAVKKRLADTIGISRQSVHNYLEIKENFGTEGLVHGYSIQKAGAGEDSARTTGKNCVVASKRLKSRKFERKSGKNAGKSSLNSILVSPGKVSALTRKKHRLRRNTNGKKPGTPAFLFI